MAAKAKLAEAKLAGGQARASQGCGGEGRRSQGGRGRGRGSRCRRRGTGGREDRPRRGGAARAGRGPRRPSATEVEHFLSSWESAIANRDMSRSTRASDCRETREFFRSNYVDKPATLALALRGFEHTAPDELAVRVQMVLERCGKRSRRNR